MNPRRLHFILSKIGLKILICLPALFYVKLGNAQCNFTSAYGSGTASTTCGTTVTLSTCNYGGEYATVTGVTAGRTYRVNSSVTTDWVTVRHTTVAGTVVSFAVQGTNWVAPVTGTYYLHFSTNNTCGTQATCRTTTITTVSGCGPINDACSAATALPCGTSSLAGTTVGSVSETAPLGYSSSFGVWYQFTGDGQSTTITSTTTFDHELDIMTGTSCGSFAIVSAVDGTTGTETYTFTTVNGQQYYIYVAHYAPGNTTTGTFTISRTCTPVAYNPCTTIPTLTCGAAATNYSMAGSAGAWSGFGGPYTTPGQEKLFSFTPTVTGSYAVTINSSAGYVDFFWKAASGGCNSTGWTYVNDILGTETWNVTLTAGVQYYLLLDDENTTANTGTIAVACISTAPVNDLVCNATAIACGGTASGTTVGATNSGTGENITCTYTQTQPGVWYVVPGNGQTMTASLCATTWDSRIAIFSGANCSSLTCVGGNDDDGPGCAGLSASYSWPSVSGTNYYILVYGYSTSAAFSLNLTCTNPTPPPCTTYLSPANGATGIDPANMTLSWNASAGATSYDIYYGTAAAPAYFTNVAGTSISITGGTTNTTYYWRIVPRNANGVLTTCTTVWSYTAGTNTNMPNFTNGAVYTCGANFYDSGGAGGTYGLSENRTITYYPATAGQSIQMVFSQFDVETNWEYLRFYDGTTTAAPQITTLPTTGTQSPAPVLSASNASGAITVNFTSDGSINWNGWAAAVSCCAPPTLPAAGTFGSNVWNVYCYKGNNLDLAGVTYKGYYVEPLLSYDTQNRWATNSTPSNASGYQGCAVELDYHTVVSKRQGFTPGYYSLSIPAHDDDIRVYVNGTVVYTHVGCCDSHGCFWSGYLDGSSTIEVRHLDGVGGSQQSLTFTQLVDPTTYGTNQWNIYNYTANFGVNVGYATNSTSSEFNLGAFGMSSLSNPATLAGYSGCNPGDDNWAMRARRQGFPCGVYNVSLAGYDDNYSIAIDFDGDGTTDYSNSGTCCNNGTGVLWTGVLNANSKVELTLVEGGGDAYLDIDFNLITPTLNGGTIAGISDGVTICYNTDPGDFNTSGSASGGTVGYTNGGSFTYSWESSTTNASAGFGAIAGATSSTYNPGNVAVTTWFRRKAQDQCGNIGYSNVVQVIVIPYASGGSIATVTSCSGGSATVSVTGVSNATNYVWNLPSGFTGSSNTNTIVVNAATVSSATNFTISVTPQNISGGATCPGTSVNGTIIVNPNLTPSLTIAATANSVCSGTSVTFTATPTNGGSAPSYQWQVNGSNVGTNSNSYVSTSLVDGDVVTCNLIANNTCQTTANASSNSITMTITPQPTWYADADADGYGNGISTTQACSQPAGYVSNATDCNDANSAVYPSATEVCNGADDDCDSSIDEGVQNTYYADADGDGYGNSGSTTLACTAPSGYVSNATDCNDASASVNPGATEVCNSIDDDCDASTDEGVQNTYYADADGDGYGNSGSTTLACTAPSGYVSNATDCNDASASVNPGATEICNGIDDDCDALTDENVLLTFYADSDSDGFGNTSPTVQACSAPAGYSSNSTDCDDTDNTIYPGATEVCDGVDQNCDGNSDDGLTFINYYADGDGDGFGTGSATSLCSNPGLGYSTLNTDCEDTNEDVYPGATEICNLIDDDCDGSIDEGLTYMNYYVDGDGDGYGSGATTLFCSNPGGSYTLSGGDCNEANSAIYPNAPELCNGIDDDCDLAVDEGALITYYLDGDNDGYGVGSSTAQGCTPPTGYVALSGDCFDASPVINPGATELCNGLDDNCDAIIDNATSTYYADVDGDGYGSTTVITAVGCTPPSGYTSNSSDCNDANGNVNPSASEICNLLDDNCNGSTDEGVLITYYQDSDADGYGNAANTTTGCSVPSGYAVSSSDCDDAVASSNPGATETCNGADDDCDALVDEGCPSTTPGEEPYNAAYAPSSYYAYCSNFYGTLEGAIPSTSALSTCITGEDKWYTFTAASSGVTIYIGSYVNNIVIELQTASGTLVDVENAVNGIGTEVLNYVGLTPGQSYRVGVRNYDSGSTPGGQFSGCIRHLKSGGCDSGSGGGGNWPGTISMCNVFKASFGGTGIQYRYTWTGLTGIAAGNVYTRTQTSDYLSLTNVTPRLPSGCMYNVLVTNIFTIPNGAGVNEVIEIPASSPCPITISADPLTQLRSSDQCSNGTRFRSSVVASLPWVCGVSNWRWRFTEVNPVTLQTVGLPIEVNRGAASNYINLGTVSALQYGKTYAVQTAPVFTYTGTNYQWGPLSYLCIIGQSGMIVESGQDNPNENDRNNLFIANDFEVALYPNPTNGDVLNISVSGVSDEKARVRILNTVGQVMFDGQWNIEGVKQAQLDINNWANGMYVLEVIANDRVLSKRFMVSQ